VPTITLEVPTAGTEIEAGLHATNYADLQTLLNGGLDNSNIDAAAVLDATARVGVRKNSAGSTFSRRRINFIEGSGVTLTVADDSGNEEVDVTIAATAGDAAGVERDYVQKTTDTAISGANEGAADTIITGTSRAWLAEKVNITFSFSYNNGPDGIILVFIRNATVIGQARVPLGAGGDFTVQDTPSAATFSYVVKAFRNGATGGTIEAGTGASGTDKPAFLRITKA
jgi:hypothetical protein